jgi:lipoprotein-anchoring transpeptidase ErfK/SrfK
MLGNPRPHRFGALPAYPICHMIRLVSFLSLLCLLPPVFGETQVSLPAPPTPEALVIVDSLAGKPTGDDAVRLQIFLDEALFGPGVIDGKAGRFTELAVATWNEVHGHPLTDWTAVNTAARKAVPNPFTVAEVPEIATGWVNKSLPYKKSQQAGSKRMSYRSIAEFMAERYHCDVPYLIQLNDSKTVYGLQVKGSIIVPNVKPFLIEKLTGKQYRVKPAVTPKPTAVAAGEAPVAAPPEPTAEELAEAELDKKLSARHVVVDTKANQVRIFEGAPPALVVAEPGADAIQPVARPNRSLIAAFPITPGQPQFIRYGTWKLLNMIELPYWRYDQQLLDTGKRSDNAINIPPGPNSPVGVIWNGLSRLGIGLHGTSDPETIGRARSAGCIRLANWDAIRLPALLRPGATVEIR